VASVARLGPIHLGLDVHKDTISVGILDPDQQVPDVERITHDEPSVRRLVRYLRPPRRADRGRRQRPTRQQQRPGVRDLRRRPRRRPRRPARQRVPPGAAATGSGAELTGGQSFDAAASRKLEAVYQTPDVIAQRHRTLTALEPREGERILDIGAGPAGLLVADMAAVVGLAGHVTGLEISDSMLAVARRRVAGSAIADRITLVQGDATALPFPDASFDAATSTQVYEYPARCRAASATPASTSASARPWPCSIPSTTPTPTASPTPASWPTM
jgi:hypothetical protein